MAAPAPSLYLVFGDDPVSIRQTVNQLVEKLCDPAAKAFNLVQLEGASLTMENLQNAAFALPFMGGQRVVVAFSPLARLFGKQTTSKSDGQADGQGDQEDLQEMGGDKYSQLTADSEKSTQTQTKKEPSAQAARKAFLSFLAAVPPSTALLLVEDQDLDKLATKKDGKIIPYWLLRWALEQKQAVRIIRHIIGTQNLSRWIGERTRQLGGSIAPQAAAALADKTGADTRIAQQEIDKLLAYVNYKRQIDADDVELVSVQSAEQSIFAYVDALSVHSGAQAMKALRRLFEERDAGYIQAMVIRQFRLLLLGRELLDESATLAEVKKVFRTGSDWYANKIQDQARRFSRLDLDLIYHRLLEMDAASKSGEIELDVALETFTAELTAPPAHSVR